MPAASLEELFDLEDPIELAIQSVLKDRSIAAFTQREFENLPEQRIDIQFELGGETGHRHADRRGQFWKDAWNYRLTLGIVTPRAGDDPRVHGLYRARVRIALQYASGLLGNSALLPYHVLTGVNEAGTSPTVRTEDDCDVSEIAYTGIVSIRSNAWPEV